MRRAWAILIFERLWRGLVFPLSIIGLFLCLSWAGLWLELPHTARLVGLLIFAGFFGFSLVRLVRTAWPSRREALDRIDHVSGFAHRPASVLDDKLANSAEDPVTRALWALHKRRAARFIGKLQTGTPSPRVIEIDRYALRGAVLVALIACAFLAGPEKYARVAAAFDWRNTGIAGGSSRVDAWIDPPPYTGKAPVLLNFNLPEAKHQDHPMLIEAPAGSTIIVRSSGGGTAIETRGALADAPAQQVKSSATGGSRQPAPVPSENEHRLLLTGDADLTLHQSGALLGAFQIHAIADQPPTIALTEAPKPNARGSLSLAYRLADDYGVASARANFSNPKTSEDVAFAGRALVEPPHIDLSLAAGAGGIGDAETTADLSDHPWAGLRATMVLTAKDEGGNEGKSEPVEITLPRKPFSNPLARALAEQRRNILLRPDDRSEVETALNALMIAPEAFEMKDSVYLGLRSALSRLISAKNDDDLVALADFLWDMALRIENGNLTDAEREMRDAEKKLRDALQNNASPEEIRKLTENLRTAMDKFLQELAQQDRDKGNEQSADQGKGQSKSVTPKQLQSMLDQLQNMAKSGNMADAQKALDQLQNILENLKSANRRNTNPQARETRRALDDLDRMSKEQQELRDETYQQSQGQPKRGKQGQRQQSQKGSKGQQQQGQGQDPSQDEDDEDAQMDSGQDQNGQDQKAQGGQPGDSDDLQQRQQALRDRLDQLQKRLKKAGQDAQGLDDAQQAMEEAEKSLGEGGEQGQEDAVEAQGQALESMRKGAQKLAEQLQKQQGQGESADGEDGGEGSSDQSDEAGDTDPTGRPRSHGNRNPGSNTPFNPMGTPAVQRAQRVLEELRRRLSDPNRPHDEMDYLERLLRRY